MIENKSHEGKKLIEDPESEHKGTYKEEKDDNTVDMEELLLQEVNQKDVRGECC